MRENSVAGLLRMIPLRTANPSTMLRIVWECLARA
jgi:hypothetical protein